MEEEEKSLLASMLGYAGETLDKPGRFFRGALSTGLNGLTFGNYGQADPRAMLNIIPFSDALGYTDPRKELNARQAYAPEAYGMNAPGSGDFLPSVGDAMFDMATDPSTYISAGIIPGFKLGLRALGEVPSMIGLGSKAINAIPDVVSTTAKVAPDVITAAGKVMPDVVPTVVSTSKGFGDMTSAGINAMEANFSRTGPPKLKAQVPETGRFIYQDVVPIDKRYANVVDDGFGSFSLNNNMLEKIINPASPLGAVDDAIKSFDYASIGKIDPSSDTIGSFSKIINQAPNLGSVADVQKFTDISQPFTYTSSVGKMDPSIKFPDIVRDKAMWPNTPIPERTYIGAGIDAASFVGGKLNKIPDGVIEKGGRFIRNAVPDQRALDEQRNEIIDGPLDPNRRVPKQKLLGW